MSHRHTQTYERILDWWEGLSASTKAAEIDDFALEFGYNSTKLEHSDVHYEEAREIFEVGTVTAYTGDVRSVTSLANQQVAFDWMLRRLAQRTPLDEEFLMRLHRLVAGGTFSRRQLADGEFPGTYKRSDYIVRETHEVGAPVQDCPRLTRELLAEVQEELDADLSRTRALTVAAYLHNQLVSIHPFSEGTGRVARELSNYVLLWADHPPIIIFKDDKEEYFAELEIFDETGDLEPFKEFLKAQTIESWSSRVRANRA